MEQRFTHSTPVCTCSIEHLSGAADLVAQSILAEHLVCIIDEREIPPDSLCRDEEPFAHAALTLNCTETAPKREVVILAAAVAPSEFDPCIAGPVRITAHEQIPFDLLGRIGIRFQSLWNYFAIEKKWKLQREDARLACAVVATQ